MKSSAVLSLCLLAGLLTGCPRTEPPSPGEVATSLRKEPVTFAALHEAAAGAATRNVLWTRESGLADLAIGATQAQVRTRLKEPTRKLTNKEGTWWEYDGIENLGALRLLFTGETALLTHIQAWAPGRQETRSMVRLLDVASRIERKYGAPVKVVDWRQGSQVWVYPAANVAYLMTPAQAPEQRQVAATFVGL